MDEDYEGDFTDRDWAELAAARSALVDALGSEGAVPLGGLAAGVRLLAEQRDVLTDELREVRRQLVRARRWDDEPVGSVGD
jgi:hypothetical protein